ncbi:MAG: hypothetical protein K2N87_06835 [Eubacterium sp.]|nr:hypothetical protein [Eubacterium sp.]
MSKNMIHEESIVENEKIKKKEILQIGVMFCWLLLLADTDAYYAPYLFVGILSFLCLCMNHEKKRYLKRKDQLLTRMSAVFFSFFVLLANYSIWSGIDYPEFAGSFFRRFYQLGLLLLLSIGGYVVMKNILLFAAVRWEKTSLKEEKILKLAPITVFFLSFLVLSVWNLFILFSCRYPGLLTYDSMNQIEQFISGLYSNHHPFYHTILLRFFVTAGFKIFGDMNAAVAVYHVFQILFMAMCFSIIVLTLYEMKVKIKIICFAAAWYLLMPFHIVYSFTMWKDVMFGGFVSLFIVSAFRILRTVGKHVFFNYVLLMVSGIGVCVFRSNGLLAFLIIFLVFIILFGKKEKRVCFLMFTTIAISFLMKHYALEILGVSQPNLEEALSIPLQQIARVAVDHNDFSDQQRAALCQVIEVDAIAEAYTAWSSDPIKNLVQNKRSQQYIIDHKFELLKTYIEIGCKHPFTYIKAWIDETKGFWNAGYPYWRWTDGVMENPYGIKQTVHSSFMDRYLKDYLWLFSEHRFLQLFLSIGFHIWINLFLCVMSIIRRDKVGISICVPVLAILATLVISTPVYAEFRYIYAVFCSLPFLIVAVFSKAETKSAKIGESIHGR